MCIQFNGKKNKIELPVHDTIFTLNILKEKRDLLFTVQNICLVQILNELHKFFIKLFP